MLPLKPAERSDARGVGPRLALPNGARGEIPSLNQIFRFTQVTLSTETTLSELVPIAT